MYKTTTTAHTNADGTITSNSVTTTPDGVVVGGHPSTHYANDFSLIVGKSRVTDICEITVTLDGVKL